MTFRKTFFCGAICAVAVTFIAVAVAQQPSGPVPLTLKNKMAINGIGGVRIGMPLTKAIDATAMSWKVGYAMDGSGCRHAEPVAERASEKTGLSFMVVDGIVVRAEVYTRGIATVSGVRVGDTEAAVKTAYPGKISSTPHPYNEKGHYLTYTPTDAKDAKYRIIFETDGVKVTSFRAGRVPEVGWIEGCL